MMESHLAQMAKDYSRVKAAKGTVPSKPVQKPTAPLKPKNPMPRTPKPGGSPFQNPDPRLNFNPIKKPNPNLLPERGLKRPLPKPMPNNNLDFALQQQRLLEMQRAMQQAQAQERYTKLRSLGY